MEENNNEEVEKVFEKEEKEDDTCMNQENEQEESELIRITLDDIEWKDDHTNLMEQLVEMFDFKFDEVTD